VSSRVLHAVVDCLQPITSCPRDEQASNSKTTWYEREYIVCHIGEIGILCVHCQQLAPPVGDIQYPKFTANLHQVEVVIIHVWSHFTPVLWWLSRWIEMEPCGCQQVCCSISKSGSHFSNVFRHWVFVIITGQIRWINRRLAKFRNYCGGGEIVARYSVGFNDRQSSKVGTVFIIHLPQTGLLVLGRIVSLVLRMNIHSRVPFLELSQLRERIKHMFWKGNLLISGVTSAWYRYNFWHANILAKYKPSCNWAFFSANAHIMLSIWLNIQLYPVIIWCRVTIHRFHIHRVRYLICHTSCMMYLTMDHSFGDVISGW